MLGGSGTIGRATVAELAARDHEVTCLLRPGSTAPEQAQQVVRVDFGDPGQSLKDALGAVPFDAVVSTLASRTGAPDDAWAVDYGAHSAVLKAIEGSTVTQFVLLSAICVQRPELAFQKAKLAFEDELQASGLAWSVVRATAFFKSLSGQVARVQSGKPFLVFGDGMRTACKPISDRDLAIYLADCLDDPARANRVLPIGGPGPALTPVDQAALLSELLGREVPLRRVPVALLDGIIAATGLMGRVSATMAARSELARIGRYYATQSMLVWDDTAQRYGAAATPEFGADTLKDHYAALLRGEVVADLGDHAVF